MEDYPPWFHIKGPDLWVNWGEIGAGQVRVRALCAVIARSFDLYPYHCFVSSFFRLQRSSEKQPAAVDDSEAGGVSDGCSLPRLLPVGAQCVIHAVSRGWATYCCRCWGSPTSLSLSLSLSGSRVWGVGVLVGYKGRGREMRWGGRTGWEIPPFCFLFPFFLFTVVI